MRFDELIAKASEKKAGDLHLVPGLPPMLRINGRLNPLEGKPLTGNEVKSLIIESCVEFTPGFENGDLDTTTEILETNPIISELNHQGAVDYGYTASNGIRTRINAFMTRAGVNIAVRIFNEQIPKPQEINMPLSVQMLGQKSHGLVLFSAPTGHGKTTSIASMIQRINETQEKRIVTIEDPVEYVYPQGKSIIAQREVGKDCKSFTDGLRSALREDPDIIVIGEIRNADSILAAISAAESGHLVFSTLHSGNVVEAIDRITQYFPSELHSVVLAQLANAFEGIICQKLLPRKDGSGRVAAFEVLLPTPATKKLMQDRPADIPGYMLRQTGMIKMEECVRELREKEII